MVSKMTINFVLLPILMVLYLFCYNANGAHLITLKSDKCGPTFCDHIPCTSRPTECPENQILSHTICDCCTRCIPIIPAGGTCRKDLYGQEPASVCEEGTKCCNSACSATC